MKSRDVTSLESGFYRGCGGLFFHRGTSLSNNQPQKSRSDICSLCRPVNLPGPKSGTWTRVLEFLDLQILHEEARLPGEMFLKAYGSCSLRTTCCVLALLECVYIQNMLHKCSGMLSHHVCLGFGGLWLACESLSETCSEAKLWDVRMGAPAALNASPRIKDKGSGFQNHASNFVGLG